MIPGFDCLPAADLPQLAVCGSGTSLVRLFDLDSGQALPPDLPPPQRIHWMDWRRDGQGAP